MGDLRILLTGATGFVGKHLTKALLSNGYQVIAIVRRSSELNQLQNASIKICFVEDGLEKVFIENKIDGIIHAATAYGTDGCISEIYETNVIFPLKILELAVKYKSSFYINTDTFFTKTEVEYAYLANYTNSKKLLGNIIEQFCTKLTIVNLKLEHVYGENDGNNKFISQMIKRLSANEPSVDLTEGMQKRDFVYIEDVINAYLIVLKNIKEIKHFVTLEVGTGKSITIREAVETIHKKTNSTSILNFGALPTRVGEFKESVADNTILVALGWGANYNFEEGIEKTIKNKNTVYGTD